MAPWHRQCHCCPTFSLLQGRARADPLQQSVAGAPVRAFSAAEAGPAVAGPRDDDEPWAVVPTWLWDGMADASEQGKAILIRGERIEAVLPADDPAVASVPAHLRFEFPGCTAIPGLIDAHVHTTAAMGPAFLAAGVTTIRDTGNDLQWILKLRSAHAANPARGPQIVCCGHLLDGEPANWPIGMGRGHSDQAALRHSVREHAAAGVDQIKLYARLDAAMLLAGADEARNQQKYVLAHLGAGGQNLGAVNLPEAVAAGINEFEHFVGLDTAWRDASSEEEEAEINELLAARIAQVPTLLVWDRYGRQLDNALLYDSRRRWVHPEQLAMWADHGWRFGPASAASRRKYELAMGHLKRFLHNAHERGVTIGLGTDTPFPHHVAGFAVHDELALYVDAGLTPVEALRCATANNARILGLDTEVGKLLPGLVADLAVVSGDPTVEIHLVGSVKFTVHRGVRCERGHLREAAEQLFQASDNSPVASALLDGGPAESRSDRQQQRQQREAARQGAWVAPGTEAPRL